MITTPAAPAEIGLVSRAGTTELRRRWVEAAAYLAAGVLALGVALPIAFATRSSGAAIGVGVGLSIVGAVGAVLVPRWERRLSANAMTWVGADGVAIRRGARTTVARFADVGEIRNDIDIHMPQDPVNGDLKSQQTFHFVMRVRDRRNRIVIACRARLPCDATSDEQLAQIPQTHPIHFALAARAAWEAWRTREGLPV